MRAQALVAVVLVAAVLVAGCGGDTPAPSAPIAAAPPIADEATPATPVEVEPAVEPEPEPEPAPPRELRTAQELARLIKHSKDALERLVLLGELAEVQWTGSCSAAIDGLCVQEVARDATPRRCDQASADRVGKVRGADASRAIKTAQQVRALWAKGTPQAALDALADAAERARQAAAAGHALSAAWFLEADHRLEQMIAVAAPVGLDFSQDAKGSTKRFQQWLTETQRLSQKASDAYVAIVGDAALTALAPAASVQAMARVGQLYAHFGATLGALAVPASVTKAGDDVATAYCDALVAHAEPLRSRAVEAWQACLARAADLGVTGAWPALCQRGLDAHAAAAAP